MLIEDLLIIFCLRNDKYKSKFHQILKSEVLDQENYDKALQYLSECLMDPQCTKDVADCFPQVLPALILMAIPAIERRETLDEESDLIHRLNCVVLGQLFLMNDNLFTYILRYFDHNPAPFETVQAPVSAFASKRRKVTKMHTVTAVTDRDIVVTSYNILRTAMIHFKHKWNWSKMFKYAKHPDDEVKWYATKCIGIILEMSEPLRIAFTKSILTNYERFMIDYEEGTIQRESPMERFSPSDNIIDNVSSVVSVGNVLLPVVGKTLEVSSDLVPVPSMEENLRSLAVAVASRKCICLQGAVGSGKTALVEYLAKVTGHDSSNFVKVQLGDQMDSKMLLGMYRCTDIPGEFVWQPGVLTEAVAAGKWLLLEDIDSAALDVASILSHLIETGTLSVPGYRDTIHATTGFQLFVTQRLIPSATGLQRQASGALNLLEKHWLCINVEPLSKSELVTVIQKLFPVLSTVASRMVDVYLLFSMGSHDDDDSGFDEYLRTGRQTSTRDLMKWCSRSIIDFNVLSSVSLLKLFQDALDVFCYSVPDQSHRLKWAIAVAHKLGIVKTKAEFFCNAYEPSISLLPHVFVAGRAKLHRKKMLYAGLDQERSNFSFTRPSACLLERITGCIVQKEPVLLVGETGTGKTSAVQYLARSTGHKLVVINMNQQSESADLLGGYKPVDFKFLISPVREEFEILFRSYFAIEPNKKFLEHVATCYKQQKWKTLVNLMNHSTTAAVRRLTAKKADEVSNDSPRSKGKPNEKRKSETTDAANQNEAEQLEKWERLAAKLRKLESQVKTQYSLAFAFIEGTLIKALRDGHWVLLDEINLANAETLECLSGLLERSSGSLSLLERGDKECVKRHENFTIFACMNPATDVGKRDLPVGLRNRFTEFYVDELTAHHDLELLVDSYLKELNLSFLKHRAIVKFYSNIRKQATTTLFDGTAHKPLYSLRTLCRALNISAANPCRNVLRSLYEAFSLSFLTQLDYHSYPIVQRLIAQAVLDSKTQKAILGSPIPKPRCGPGEDYICFEGYWVVQGSLEPETPENYILTQSVRRNLKDLVRVVSIGKIPVLLQGDTSVGKTSLITYLAKASGNVCVRINNHEHTDLQEYVGSYVADVNGKLVFQEGVLVEAMRKGHWIILDELNLAPSDVLEALNRVLDDNRELYIPETQQTVKAHDNFMLFATQNPPGLYGGRKVLSRAFRNRFVELHFDEIPANELQIILHERCSMPKSYCEQVISVMTDLQRRRKSTAAFAGKQGFITLRDLFRWGERYRLAPDMGEQLYDWHQHLADEGYLVLSAKVRKAEEADEIRQVIKKHLKRDVDPNRLFTLNNETSTVTKDILEELLNNVSPQFKHIVWTYHMRRMAVLVKKSCQFKEPVLLVGETGGGKTTVCQLIAAINNQSMHCVNCHMHTESSDFLGNLRPVREHSAEGTQKLFEWVDGPLINAMRNGDLFLADEISLADDSVLERLNSLLEPERSLLLAERGLESVDGKEVENVIVADTKFIFIGTMNPGGDYGKRELSPALRNRFTEVWCEGCVVMDDLRAIIEHNVHVNLQPTKESIAKAMLNFVQWLPTTEIGKKFVVSIRDVLTWVNFVNTCIENGGLAKLTIGDAYYHGACLTYIDSLGSGLTGSENASRLIEFRDAAMTCVEAQIKDVLKSNLSTEESMETDKVTLANLDDVFGIPPFYIQKGSRDHACKDESFTFSTPTTSSNTLKLLRALQLRKPILLEGSPGVGKTSLVSALAKVSGHSLLRINLSDQTDVSDLFGADLPVEGGKSGQFAWKDGPFLRALRAGHWILLDELNLASQSVLEGLNACFDHRGEVYIPELGKTFSVKLGTRLFGCQNPLRQGGSRRGLPKSFLNRFTQVFIDALMEDDLETILRNQFPALPADLVRRMIKFNSAIASEVGVSWGFIGSPWEMNLRDVTRWCESVIRAAEKQNNSDEVRCNPGNSVDLIYAYRMRTEEDRQKVRQVYQDMFPAEEYPRPPTQLPAHITDDKLYIGDVFLNRTNSTTYTDCNLLLLRDQKVPLRSLMQCVQLNWMSILVGGSGCGKSSLVRLLASLVGQKLRSIAVNSAMDTTEILGGFEQTNYNRHLEGLFERTECLLIQCLKNTISRDNLERVAECYGLLEKVRHLSEGDDDAAAWTMAAETKLFLRKVDELAKLVAAMKMLDSSNESELNEIGEGLKKLSRYVKQDKCPNAGGKFEWVDSALVKCLRDGTWLLIDQVNLCNPAVLDRLNGLLEPNGVLSIGEQGVDSEGNVVTIKPHKNFRLFLTMDPRYGEISRAMRNRGVEIYMLGPKENVEYNNLDLRSLLHSVGLTNHVQQGILLEIHRVLAQELITVERLTVVELIHSAFLATQQLSCSFPVKQSIRTACIDIYIKAKSIRDPRVKDRFTSIIEEITERFLPTSNDTVNYFDLSAATWSVNNLQENYKLTMIRQQSLLLSAVIKAYKTHLKKQSIEVPTTAFMNDFLCLRVDDETIINARIDEILPHLLLNFYELSSRSDVDLRRRWISKISGEEGLTELCEVVRKSTDLSNEIASFNFHSAKDSLPWDAAQLCNVCQDLTNDDLYDANRLALVLYLRAMIRIGENALTETEPEKNNKTMSVMQYSNAIYHGKLSSRLKSQPLITSYVKFVAQLQTSIDSMLRDGNLMINTRKYVDFRNGMQWCARFRKLGEMTLVDKSRKSQNSFTNLDEIALLLRVHFKWLSKFLRRLFIAHQGSSFDEKTTSEMTALSTMLEDINNKLISVHDPFRKLSKIMKKYLILPLPHTSEDAMQICLRVKRISSVFAPWLHDSHSLKQELKLLSIDSGDALSERHKIISLCTDLYSDKAIDRETSDTVSKAEEFIQLAHLALNTPTEIAEVLRKINSVPDKELKRASTKIQLWPFYEYIFILYSHALQSNLCRSASDNSIEITMSPMRKFTNVPSIPINIIGMLSATSSNEVDTKRRLLLLPELFVSLEKFVEQSYAMRNSKFLLHFDGITEQDLEASIVSCENISPQIRNFFDGPVLVYLILELLLNEAKQSDDTLAASALGSHAARVDQLKCLNETLWRNSVALSSTRYSLRNNDLVALKFYVNLYTSAIQRMDAEYDIRELVDNVIKTQTKFEKTEMETKFRRCYVEPVEELDEMSKKLESDDEKDATVRGKTWMLLGYVQMLLFGNLGYIDPVQKVALKLMYLEEDIANWRRSVYVSELQSRVLGTTLRDGNRPSRLSEIDACLENLSKERENVRSLKAFRPSSSDFVVLARETDNFRNTMCTYDIICKHANSLINVASDLHGSRTNDNLKKAEDVLQEAEVWKMSVQRFSEQLEAKYLPAYPDIVLPLLSALNQIKHGVAILINEIKRTLSLAKIGIDKSTMESLIYNLARYPTIGKQQESILNLVSLCTSKDTKAMIGKVLSNEDRFVAIKEQFKMIKCGLCELYNHVTLNRELTKDLWRDMNALLHQVVMLWKQQEEEKQKRAAEKESMYKNKAEVRAKVLSEDEQIEVELRNLFPTYRDDDFGDIDVATNPSLEEAQKQSTDTDASISYCGLISEEDIREIQELHSTIVASFTTSSWLNCNAKNSPNYVQPLIQRYHAVGLLLDNVTSTLDEGLSANLCNSLNFLATLALDASGKGEIEKNFSVGVKGKKVYDYYKDSNVDEAKRCIPLLDTIFGKVNELLEEWPEHPTLRSIQLIIDRVYGFPVTSSISRFLTGLELLLVKMHQWEENAHSGVSLSEYTLQLTQQIISWRQLELACWKNCLNTTQQNLKGQTSKWWFHLYSLTEGYLLNSDNEAMTVDGDEAGKERITKKTLIESLERFVNESSLIEFEARLDLLRTFHCHVCYFDPSPRKNELLAILWNLHNYYKQFVNDVNTKISNVKAPIEKKLKDFVKIARWNDISYWAVKETVEKTHRTLHKFTREFEKGLKQSASSCLAIKPEAYNTEASKGIWDDQAHTEYLIDPVDFTVGKIRKGKSIKDTFTKCDLISRTDFLLTKAKNLCKEVVLLSSYPCIRIEIENLIQDFMEHGSRLRNLEIDRTQTKEKQKSQAKYILQQKRLALANYFKTLTRMGVSYRTGNLTWRNDTDKVANFTVPPLDLSGVGQYFTVKQTDEQMLVQWSGCEKYYYRSFIKLNALSTMLKSTQTDLGPQNAERCLGFSAHIMLMANGQKATLAELFDHLVSLRMQVSNLSQMDESNLNMPRQCDLRTCSESLKRLLIALETGFQQLELYLQCCPDESLSEVTNDDVLVLDADDLPIQNANRGNETWLSTKSLIADCLTTVKATMKRYDTVFAFKKMLSNNDDRVMFLTSKHFAFLKDSYTAMQNLSLRMKDLSNVFSGTGVVHPILNTIVYLESQIEENVRNFEELQRIHEGELENSNDQIELFEQNLEALMSSILLTIQRKYKENMSFNEDVSAPQDRVQDETDTNEDDGREQISENKFKAELVEALQKDVKNLTIEKISKRLDNLLLAMQELDMKSFAYCSRLLLRCVPFLEQYTLLVQYYLNEQVASFRVTCKMLYLQLNVFLDLAMNGFCIPKDLDIEEGDGGQMQDSKSKGGMGLGDGEGEKDVSDRIESEDQLEDARLANEEQEKSEDKDCKEEEKGIDMSEDFDSKLQNMEKDKDQDEDDKDDEDDELDKEMGETGETADQLDKEIWGEDKEESEEENDAEDRDEGQGQGEETGEKEIGAKDDKNKGNKDEDKEDREGERQEDQKKDINEMDESETNEDQIDPYHATNQPPPEPEPLDLPDDLNLDNEDGKEEQEGNEENPFDIDEMKESRPPPEKDADESKETEEQEQKEADPNEDSSEDEGEGEKVRDEPRKEDSVDDNPDPVEERDDQAQGEDIKESDENKDEDKEKEEDEEGQQEKATPSINDASKQMDASEEVDNTEGSKDKVAKQESQNEQQQEAPTENDQDDSNNKGTGQAQSEEQDSGHTGSSTQKNVPVSERENDQKEIEKRKNPGKSDDNRSLMDNEEPERKKLKVTHSKDELKEGEETEDTESNERKETEMCEHIKNAEKFDDVAMDAATEEQVKQQASNMETEEQTQEKEDDSMDVDQHEDEKDQDDEMNVPEQNPEKVGKSKSDKRKKDAADKDDDAEESQVEGAVVIEGEVTKTSTVERGNESTHYTKLTDSDDAALTSKQIERRRFEIEKMLSEWTCTPSTQEASTAWNFLSTVTDSAARDLSEKLRLVLEPTQASRLKGDYKTGKRINMRKIIPYIASEFRKDKIWLRRTKPSKRDYQIVLAIDDSSSMADNHSKELAFESLSLISKAMTYLEAGQLGVINFGEKVNMLHPLGEAFTEQSGARLIQEMRFEQKKTMVGQLVDFIVDMFEGRNVSSNSARLLVVLSDGRGIFSEAADKVNCAIRRAKLADIFLVFIIVENPMNRESILDIRIPVFEDGKLLDIRPYMDRFPFPFYMILRDINMLPGVLSDALRQWFEIVGKIDI